MTELNTISVLSERAEKQEQLIAELVIEKTELQQQLAAAEAGANKSFVEKLELADLLVAKDEALQDALHFLTQIDPVCWPSRQEARKIITTIRNALASPAAEPVVPEALCWVLWYHQGANSPIGQSIRQVLGMTRFQRMSDKQVEAAKAWAAENPWLQQAQPAPATEPAINDRFNAVIGCAVSLDVSTGEHDADHRMFGRITQWQRDVGEDSGVIFLAELEYDNAEPEKVESEGWKLVPVEPTEEMLAAGGNAVLRRFYFGPEGPGEDEVKDAKAAYSAMLAAAPQQEQK